MARPPKIDEPTKTYVLLMKQKQFDELSVFAKEMQKKSLEQVAVADLIREAIDIYLDALKEESDEIAED
jgi:hypothetical protein